LHLPPSSVHLQQAVDALHRGGVIACPTEAVWGLSCNPDDEEAVHRLLLLKGRPMAKGLIMVASSSQQLDFLLADLSGQQRQTLADSWPGPATWLLPHQGQVPYWIRGDHDTVAVRVSNHPVLKALCTAWGGPLVSTSANRAGALPAREAFQVRRYFGDRLDYLLPGRVDAAAMPTSIRDLASDQFIRN
jgi:L-threonylcarbamoyladenylate synthase